MLLMWTEELGWERNVPSALSRAILKDLVGHIWAAGLEFDTCFLIFLMFYFYPKISQYNPV